MSTCLVVLLVSYHQEADNVPHYSSTDQRNATNGMTPYVDPKWHNIHPGAEALAKGKWSTPEDDPSWFSGYRRYGASKLCAVMLM